MVEEGQLWKDGIDPGYIWQVESIEDGIVHLWFGREDSDHRVPRVVPENRWARHVDRQKLVLAKRDAQ